MSCRFASWYCASLIVLAIFPAPAVAAPQAGDIAVERRTATLADGATIPYEIGTIQVPEHRAVPGSRLIKVGFARIRARTPTGAPPVFWLPGGPGLAVLDSFDGATEAARARLRTWASFGTTADLVVVEQRGNTLRGEQLVTTRPAQPLDRPRTARADLDAAIGLARRAIADHPGKDLAGYTVRACAEDVDAVRRALGYERIALFGGSFGSQWSFAIMQLYPDSVARAVLSGIEPLDNGYDMPSPHLATLRRIAAEADAEPALQPWMPPGGLMAAAAAVRERLTRQPVTVTLRDSAGAQQTVLLGLEDFQGDLLHRASDPAQWPAFVLALYHGHYEEWARAVAQDRQARPVKLVGPLIDTSLGVTPGRLRQLRADPALAWFGSGDFEPSIAAAEVWPTPDMGDTFRTQGPSPIPLLMVHGDWDASTPIDNMLEQLPHFANGHGLIVHRGGHDGAFYLLREQPQVKEAVYRFLRTGRMEGLPAEVTLPAPRFVVPDFPAPAPARPAGV